eukprot:6129378-Prymnesium_polylepis.1
MAWVGEADIDSETAFAPRLPNFCEPFGGAAWWVELTKERECVTPAAATACDGWAGSGGQQWAVRHRWAVGHLMVGSGVPMRHEAHGNERHRWAD